MTMLMIDSTLADGTLRHPLDLLRDAHRRLEWQLLVMADVVSRADHHALATADREALRSALAYLEVGGAMHATDETISLFARLRLSDETGGVLPDLVARLEVEDQAIREQQGAVGVLCRRWLSADLLTSGEVALLRGHLEVLDEAWRAHIEVQELDLFPLAACVLDADVVNEIGREMLSRRNVRCEQPSVAAGYTFDELEEWDALEYRLAGGIALAPAATRPARVMMPS
jgi:hemerythrin-like domain-containing protein